jgi:hypothetical protein
MTLGYINGMGGSPRALQPAATRPLPRQWLGPPLGTPVPPNKPFAPAPTTPSLPPPPSSPSSPFPIIVPRSKSQKGAIFEWGLSNLALFLSGGDLELSRPQVDDKDVDRILTRLAGRRASFLQLKTRAAPLKGGALELHFPPIADAGSREDLYLLAGELIPRSPWVGPRFALIPANRLPAASPSKQVSLRILLRPGAEGQWARFVHDRGALATLLSKLLDRGPAYPFPPPGGPKTLVKKLTPPARGHIVETEVATAAVFHSGGRLNLWSPLVDDFGEDFAITNPDRTAALRLQPKGGFDVDRGGRFTVHVPKRTFRPSDFDFLVFARYRPELPALHEWAYVIRADEFAKLARVEATVLTFRARPDPGSKDKWRPWLYRIEEVAGVLEAALAVRKARGAGAKLPARREEVAAARQVFTRD